MRAIKGCGILLVVVLLGIGALIGGLWVEHRSPVTLPAPTGPFPVGRVACDWADGTKREILVWIWYPCAEGGAIDDYVPANLRAPKTGGGLLRLLTRDPSIVHGHSHRGAALSPRQASYPVVLLRGGASAGVLNYSTIAEDLASHGYVVAGIDAPYRTSVVVFPDGRVVRRTDENNPELYSGAAFDRLATRLLAAWTSDMTFALDRLAQWNPG